MRSDIRMIVEKISDQLKSQLWSESAIPGVMESTVRNVVENETRDLPTDICNRIQNEYFGLGPIQPLVDDPSITEILVNSSDEIWFERQGTLYKHDDSFYSELSYKNFVQFLCREMTHNLTLDRPFVCSHLNHLRVHIAGPAVSANGTCISIRKKALSPWTLKKLEENQWCSPGENEKLQKLVHDRLNFLVIGCTGSGKTSVLNALLNEIGTRERAVILEDTQELFIPNTVSTKLVTREDPNNLLPPIGLGDLVRQSLRMRPDRLVVGEVRGSEAKDLLLALSTGHSGSLGTLHASSPHEALLRLEMLIQMGAPHWSLDAIRRLIFLCINAIVVAHKSEDGQRRFNGVYRIASVESFGLTLDRVF